MRSKNFRSVILALSLVLAHQSLAVEVNVDLSRVGDSTHLEFSGSQSWSYDIKQSDKKKIVLNLADLTPKTIDKLKAWKDSLLSKVEVLPGGVDGTYKVTFHLADSEIRSFDYLTDQPSRLIVDFFVPEEEELAELTPSVKPATPQKSLEKTVKKEETKITKLPKKIISQKIKVRKPAGVDFITVDGEEPKKLSLNEQFMYGIYDGGDPNIARFRIKDSEIRQEAIRASRQNIYLHFPRLDLGLHTLEELRASQPEYEVLPNNTEENKVARLLHTLYKRKKHAMFTKTHKYFKNKFPKSKYEEMISYMEADLHYDRWRTVGSPVEFATAMAKYRSLIEKYPDSILTDRTFLLVGFSYLEKKDTFGALKTFQRFLRLKPKTKYKSQVEIAIAKVLLKMNRFDESLEMLARLATKAKERESRVEAEYISGDVLFKKKEYRKAIRLYKKALKRFPNDWHDYPNVFFNMAESLFWVEKYKSSLDTYIEFLKRHPSNTYGGYAMTRIGEILEILGADSNKVMGAFLESHFRYRGSQGGDLARVQILTARMGEMKPKEIVDALKELEQIIERSKLAKINQFVKVKIADGYHDRGEFDNGIDVLTKFYQDNPTKINTKVFSSRIVRNIASKIRQHRDGGDFLKCMSIYSQYKDSWLKKSNRIDITYDQGQCYEQAGVYDQAASLYRNTLNRLYAVEGTPAEKDRSVFEKTPSADELNLRIAAVNLRDHKLGEANNFMKEIKSPKKMKESQQVELVEIAAKIAEERGQSRLAISFLNKLVDTWKGRPELVSGPYLRLAELYKKNRQYNSSESSLQKVLNLVTDTGKVSGEHHFKALELLGQVQEKQNKTMQAARTYEELLQKFSGQRNLDSTRYHVGDIYFKAENYKQAERTWKPLEKAAGSVWQQLAEEKMKSVDWSSNYSKYIKRIPAMKNFKQEQ